MSFAIFSAERGGFRVKLLHFCFPLLYLLRHRIMVRQKGNLPQIHTAAVANGILQYARYYFFISGLASLNIWGTAPQQGPFGLQRFISLFNQALIRSREASIYIVCSAEIADHEK